MPGKCETVTTHVVQGKRFFGRKETYFIKGLVKLLKDTINSDTNNHALVQHGKVV